MFWNKYPHTDLHELNLDWILGVVKKIDDDIEKYVREQIDKLFVQVLYDEETETLFLKLKEDS